VELGQKPYRQSPAPAVEFGGCVFGKVSGDPGFQQLSDWLGDSFIGAWLESQRDFGAADRGDQ
jgi:hypothetical protein